MHGHIIAMMVLIVLPFGCSGAHRPQEAPLPITHTEGDACASTRVVLPVQASSSEPVVDANGVTHYTIQSPYQRGITTLRLAEPPQGTSHTGQRFLFVLPVEPGEENHYGDGLFEVLRHRLHARHRLVVVAPSFSDWPWYADHPSDPQIRQESYLLNVILPLVDRLYPTARPRRLLLGFSKSGWGAMTLILRHPDLYDAACVWDAPLMMDQPGRYNSGAVFQTQESFENYRVSYLLQKNADAFRAAKRIGLMGYCNFRDDMQQTHELMDRLNVPHVYVDGSRHNHAWDSGWVEEAVDLLVTMADSGG
jgi:hypothetical protein